MRRKKRKLTKNCSRTEHPSAQLENEQGSARKTTFGVCQFLRESMHLMLQSLLGRPSYRLPLASHAVTHSNVLPHTITVLTHYFGENKESCKTPQHALQYVVYQFKSPSWLDVTGFNDQKNA